MFTTLSVQLPTHTLIQLVEQLKRRPGTQDLSEAMTQAVEFWLADQRKLPATADPNGLHGYQWKCLFLPEGTVLRSWSYGEHNYASVEGDHIIHQGKVVTPNQFARSFARSTRNAWEDLYIRRPGDQQFKLACVLRKEVLSAQDQRRKSAAAATLAVAPTAGMVSAAASPAATPELQAPAPAPEPPPASSPAVAARDTSPGEGWTLPERRQWRFRLEDVAFD